MELLVVIVGIVLVWKFSSAINALATSAKVKTEVMSEEIIVDSVQKRTQIMEEYVKSNKDKTVYSHNEIMQMFKVED